MIALLLLLAVAVPGLTSQVPASVDAGRKRFQGLCAPCHGADGAGGERGPSIVDARRFRLRSDTELRELITKGVPGGGMPGFTLPVTELDQLVAFLRALTAPASAEPASGNVAAGEAFFAGAGKCLTCHMVNGKGSPVGPDLSDVGNRRKLREIEQALRQPEASIAPGFAAATARLRDGRALRGIIKNQSNFDLQLQGLDGAFHLLRKGQIAEIRRESASLMPALQADAATRQNLLAFLSRLPRRDALAGVETTAPKGGIAFADIAKPAPGEWPTYDGSLTGNRHSPLTQITPENVKQLGVRWMYTVPNARLQATPIVSQGIMYITHGNDVHAVDSGTGRLIWRWSRPKTPQLVGDPIRGFNRGLALLGDRVFFQTDNGHLVALHRLNGSLLWEADLVGDDVPVRNHYGATSAPLIVGDLVIAGIAGGDGGIRGFLDAYHPQTGERVWRFWTVPKPGEPLASTWKGKALEVGCGATWMTGTYDPALDLLYWTTGNPCPDYNGDERLGDNLYTSSILALRPKTGKLEWYYQATPHDMHDFDAQQTPMLIEARFRGRDRKLLVQASRNGFFYVLDRASGELLSATPFVDKLTWASGIGPDGKPKRVPGTEPSTQGSRACPAPEGANNWMSNSYDPQTGLFYLVALEKCAIYVKSVEWLIRGEQFYGGGARMIPGEPGRKHLRAIDVATGKIAWDREMEGPATTWGGVVSTAAGLVFYCDDSGAFAAADSRTGEPLWHFHTNQPWRASPMTFAADGKQYVAVAAGSAILVFGLP